MDGEIDAVLDDLEVPCEWRDDAPEVVRDLRARLPEAAATWVQRARLTLLDVDGLVRDHAVAGAVVEVLGIRDRAVGCGHRVLQARAELALSHLFRRIEDMTAALEHAVAALALDGDDLDPVLRCRTRLAMANAVGERGSSGDARRRYREVLERSRSLGSPETSFDALNNWAYTEVLAGHRTAAWDLAERLRALAAAHGRPLRLVHAGTVAEILHAHGRSDEAVTMLREHLGHEHPHAIVDAAGCWLTLSQIEREVGDLDGAGTSLDAADHLTTTHGLHGLRVEGVGSRAELLAARGDHAGAYQAHVRFHDQTLALRSTASEARAQTQHAMYEADTARRDAARYREMSYRDPLTRLLNRRHVDEDLDARLARGDALAIAMIDLDRFKTVNDTFSHATGDAVLVRIATLLTDAAAGVPGAYAARLGGEEFLLVLPGHDLTTAHDTAETLRRTIAAHDWDDIAPGLPVTASTGLATTAPGAPLDRADLLRTADTHLHTAKSAGRDRVEPPHAGDLKQPGRDADGRPWPPTSTRPPVR